MVEGKRGERERERGAELTGCGGQDDEARPVVLDELAHADGVWCGVEDVAWTVESWEDARMAEVGAESWPLTLRGRLAVECEEQRVRRVGVALEGPWASSSRARLVAQRQRQRQ